jgi:hypothetical protein
MYRQQMRQQILYGQFREYMEIADQIIDLRQKRGLAEAIVLVPMFGTANEAIWETEYADLATFERENEAFYGDAELMKQWRRLWQHAVQGSTRDELLEGAPRIA